MKKIIIIVILILGCVFLNATITKEKIEKDSKLTKKIDNLYQDFIILKDLKKYEESKLILKKIISLDETQADTFLLLSEIEYLLNNWQNAIEGVNEYLKIIDTKDKKNYLDISWAYFLIGETSNSMDYIIEFFKYNMPLMKENFYILIDSLIKKGFYHLISSEDPMFYIIVSTLFQIEINDNILFTIFLNNLNIIRKIPFYYFERIRLKDIDSQMKALKTVQNEINWTLT